VTCPARWPVTGQRSCDSLSRLRAKPRGGAVAINALRAIWRTKHCYRIGAAVSTYTGKDALATLGTETIER